MVNVLQKYPPHYHNPIRSQKSGILAYEKRLKLKTSQMGRATSKLQLPNHLLTRKIGRKTGHPIMQVRRLALGRGGKAQIELRKDTTCGRCI
jgi:hypothetical protein